MGCIPSTRVTDSHVLDTINTFKYSYIREATVIAALEKEISIFEKQYSIQRLAVVSAELRSIELELRDINVVSTTTIKDEYAKTMHQVISGLNLYRCPLLAAENEDVLANINRKEMQRFEVAWLKRRQDELQREIQVLQSGIIHYKEMCSELKRRQDSLWADKRPELYLEKAVNHAKNLRDALASVSVRLRAAAEYLQNALRMLDDAILAWKIVSIGRSGWERTRSCAAACHQLLQVRFHERSARRVLGSQTAPRAARSTSLALDYAFTDILHDHKYQRASETFHQFKIALGHLVSSINEVGIIRWIQNLIDNRKKRIINLYDEYFLFWNNFLNS